MEKSFEKENIEIKTPKEFREARNKAGTTTHKKAMKRAMKYAEKTEDLKLYQESEQALTVGEREETENYLEAIKSAFSLEHPAYAIENLKIKNIKELDYAKAKADVMKHGSEKLLEKKLNFALEENDKTLAKKIIEKVEESANQYMRNEELGDLGLSHTKSEIEQALFACKTVLGIYNKPEYIDLLNVNENKTEGIEKKLILLKEKKRIIDALEGYISSVAIFKIILTDNPKERLDIFNGAVEKRAESIKDSVEFKGDEYPTDAAGNARRIIERFTDVRIIKREKFSALGYKKTTNSRYRIFGQTVIAFNGYYAKIEIVHSPLTYSINDNGVFVNREKRYDAYRGRAKTFLEQQCYERAEEIISGNKSEEKLTEAAALYEFAGELEKSKEILFDLYNRFEIEEKNVLKKRQIIRSKIYELENKIEEKNK